MRIKKGKVQPVVSIEDRINAAAYYVEEHLEDWTTLLSFTVPYARYTDVPNAK